MKQIIEFEKYGMFYKLLKIHDRILKKHGHITTNIENL